MISILMGIYNCATTLPDAIKSIQNQTITDWELILCDDGSSDNTYQVASKFAQEDRRIILLKNEHNLGLNITLNKCLAISKGDYIARMDGDDICDPLRFEKQLAVLNQEPNISIVSSPMYLFNEKGIWGRTYLKEYPEKLDFINGPPISHAPCMVRREAFMSVNGYSELSIHRRSQDYHLWAKMYAQGYRAKNIQEPLYSMREDENAYKRRTFTVYKNSVIHFFTVYHMLNIPYVYYPYALRPLFTALTPKFIYGYIRKKMLRLNK